MNKIPKYLVQFYIKIKTPAKRKSFIETYNYIKFLSSNFKVPVSESFLVSLISNNEFIDKDTINSKIFEYIKNEKEIVSNINQNIDITKLSSIFDNIDVSNQIDAIQRTIISLSDNIKNYTISIEDFSRQIINLNVQKNNLKNDTKRCIIETIEKSIISNKFSKIYFNKSNSSLFFVQKNDCILENINFGRYAISWKIMTNDFSVHPYKNNVTNGNSIHPHIFFDSRICWGNAAAAFSDNVSKLKFSEIVFIADQILNNWNPQSPVVNINSSWEPVSTSTYRFRTNKYVTEQYYIEFQNTHASFSKKEWKNALNIEEIWEMPVSEEYSTDSIDEIVFKESQNKINDKNVMIDVMNNLVNSAA